jgi:hypothetical protein
MESEEDVRYSKSYVTDQWYRVTEWEEVDEPENGKQKIIAKEKEPVDKSEVPDHIVEAMQDE